MNALAALVASFGLLQGSTAVVIGAMLIAMLWGPIMGMALALVDANQRLLKSASMAEATGAVLVLVIGMAVGLFSHAIPLSDEILSRTEPTILDMFVALAGGAAGAYASVSKRLSPAVTGVAIATALVPPLAASGICLARGSYQLGFGAMLLFCANLVAIQAASSIVFWSFGYRNVLKHPDGLPVWLRRNAMSASVLLLLVIVLGANFQRSLGRLLDEQAVRRSLENDLKQYPGARLVEIELSRRPKRNDVLAVVRCPYSLSPDRVRWIESRLPLRVRPCNLRIRTVLTKEADRESYRNE